MKRSLLIFSAVMFIVFLALGLVVLAGGLRFLVEQVRLGSASMDPQTAIIVGTATLTALFSAWLVSSAIRSASRNTTTSESCQARIESYIRLLECTLRRTQGEDVETQLAPLEAALFVRGAASVVREYQRLNEFLASSPGDSRAVDQHLQSLVAAMRRDTGLEMILPASSPGPTEAPAATPNRRGDLIFQPVRKTA